MFKQNVTERSGFAKELDVSCNLKIVDTQDKWKKFD